MDQFIAQILAKLDTRQAEADLTSLTKDRDINLRVKLTGDANLLKTFQSDFNSLSSLAEKSGNNAGKSYATAMQRQIETVARTQRNAFSEPLNNMTKSQKSYSDWWNKELNKQEKQIKSFTQLDATTASNKTLSWLKNNSKAAKDYGAVLKDLANKQKLATNADELKEYTKQINAIKSEAAAMGKTGRSITDEVGNSFKRIGQFAYTYGLIQQIPDTISRMVQAVYDVDTAMTNLYKVTDETSAKYNEFLDSAGTKAKELGRDMSSYIEQTANWSKLGYTLDQASKLSEVSSIYANVGEVDDATAVSDIVTAMKAFNIEAENSMSIIDALNKLGNEFATSSADLGEGLTKSASSLNTAGVDLNHALAMLTGGSEITQNASEFGNFLKVSSMRIRGKLLCLHTRKVCMPCYAQ